MRRERGALAKRISPSGSAMSIQVIVAKSGRREGASKSKVKIMKRLPLTLLALLCLSSAAYAQSDARLAAAASSDNRQYSAIASIEQATSDRNIGNANDCAPDRARPVWGANSALLGYSCYRSER